MLLTDLVHESVLHLCSLLRLHVSESPNSGIILFRSEVGPHHLPVLKFLLEFIVVLLLHLLSEDSLILILTQSFLPLQFLHVFFVLLQLRLELISLTQLLLLLGPQVFLIPFQSILHH